MAKETVFDFDLVDDFYLSALFDDEENGPMEAFPVSDAKYAEELQLQEALMGAVIISQMENKISSSIPMIELSPEPNPKETGESSLCFCEICVERKEIDQMFKIDSCVHSFCSDCISKHVATKIQDSACTIITCPGMNCPAILELDICRSQLSKGVIDIWEEILCEEMISESEKFYCPFKDCSALLVNDNGGGEAIRESECPFCHRLFCAQCYVPWHSGVECEVFQWLKEDERGREDLMVMELARDKKWSRCPHCKFFVERTEGCPHMTCRCKFEFCYGCGSQWTASHGGCQRN
ncbi:probable E3 ubiquitin-protein ligase RNF144A-B [Jatropha curcas]|uniref:probable E3 ubiquitin-protein ligase RNF144A-B n=1 Tax=Jatropha curcas TaxID=180498 RepID=UPI001895612F|nr:probable E3 ubiquitin-protein ligase RNF144A-B [Jatropha curcas]